MNNIKLVALCPHAPIMVPEIGKDNSSDVQTTIDSMTELSRKIVDISPDTIIFVTPHSVFNPYFFSVYSDVCLSGDFRNFRAPQVQMSFENDLDFINMLEETIKPVFKSLNRISAVPLDHGTMVPLYFFKKAGYNGKIAVINYCALGNSEHMEFGKLIKNTAEKMDKNYVFIASGDLSHRVTQNAPAGYAPEGAKFDQAIENGIKNGNYASIIGMDFILREKAGECAYNSLLTAFGLLDRKPLENKVYSYQAPFGVGYLVATL